MATSENLNDRDELLRDVRRRLTQLELETHRMRAELARLEAAGEDEAADKLEAELRAHQQQIDKQHHQGPSPSEAIPATIPAAATQPLVRPAKKEKPQSAAPLTIAIEPREEEDSSPRSARRRRLPPWVVSLGVHAVLVLALGTLSFATLQDFPNPLLSASIDGDEDILDEIALIDFATPLSDELEEDNPLTDFEALDFNEVELSEADAPWAESEIAEVSPSTFDSPPVDFGSLMTDASQAGGAGEAGKSANKGGGPRGGTKFFGARSKGGRFVFAVDNSGTMNEGRMETTLIEIERSVGKMSEDQLFHVMFYSDQVYPMFFPDSIEKLAPATQENKRRLSQWLRTVEMCVGGEVNKALELAAKMKPDTVFLLSDGDIWHTRVTSIMNQTDWTFVINTLGMTVAESEHAQTLVAIAKSHNGLYFPVGVNPIGAQMARQRPITYHNSRSGPGKIWGTKVGR